MQHFGQKARKEEVNLIKDIPYSLTKTKSKEEKKVKKSQQLQLEIKVVSKKQDTRDKLVKNFSLFEDEFHAA